MGRTLSLWMIKKQLIGSTIIILLLLLSADSLSQNIAKKSYNSSEILELINNSVDIYLEDIRIIGDLKLSRSQKFVNSSISIKDSDIMGDIDFGNAFFHKPVSFAGTTFSGNRVNFMNSEFANDINFSGAIFNCNAYFSGIQTDGNMIFIKTTWLVDAFFNDIFCNGSALFRNSEFYRQLSLTHSLMNGSVDFDDSQFDSDASFRNSIFRNNVTFKVARFSRLGELKDAIFYKNTAFTRSRFGETADFSGSIFMGGAEFFQTNFANAAVFSQARFNTTSFKKCVFNGFADFSSVKFLGTASFNESQFNKAARFTNSTFLENVSFSSAFFDRDAYFDAARFESKINITNAAFSELALPWDAIEGRVIYDKATRLSLINNYKKLGWTSDYKDSYYNYREEKRTYEPLGLEKFLDILSLGFWGYGTKMYYSLAWIIFFALFFAFVYYGLTHIKWAEAVEISNEPGLEKCPYAKKEHDLGGKLSFKQALLFSIKTLLLMENQDNIKIRHAHVGKIIWIEKVVCGYLAVNFMNYLLELLQSYFKLP
ncbi:MAG: pentapeptide repeat-containing protein [Methanothrix sp.]